MRDGEVVELVELRRQMSDGRARSIREGLGLGLTEIGQAANVDASTVWRWENGKRRPSGAAAVRYFRLLRLLEKRQRSVR